MNGKLPDMEKIVRATITENSVDGGRLVLSKVDTLSKEVRAYRVWSSKDVNVLVTDFYALKKVKKALGEYVLDLYLGSKTLVDSSYFDRKFADWVEESYMRTKES